MEDNKLVNKDIIDINNQVVKKENEKINTDINNDTINKKDNEINTNINKESNIESGAEKALIQEDIPVVMNIDNNIKNDETVVVNTEASIPTDSAVSSGADNNKDGTGEKKKSVKITKGQNYKKLKRMMKTTKTMSICNSRVDMFKYLSKQFKKLKDYKNSEELAEKCTKQAKKTKKLIKKQIYDDALNLKNNARQSEDYKFAANEFRKLPGYLNAEELATECDELGSRLEKKTTFRRITVLGFLIILFVSLILFMNTAYAKYNTANLLMITGSYGSAIKIYNKLGDYSASQEKISEAQYLKGIELLESGSYKEALAAFKGAGDYKDSHQKVADTEKLIIKSSKIKDTVKLGKHEWIILDINNNSALLLIKKALTGIAYNDSINETTWEVSTLRQWLNSEFLTGNFTLEERNNIILSEISNSANRFTGIDGGNTTQDYIFVMNLEEAEKYADVIPKIESNTWLRTPGNSQNTAAFLTSDKRIMENGYAVNSDKLAVRPVLWFSVE